MYSKRFAAIVTGIIIIILILIPALLFIEEQRLYDKCKVLTNYSNAYHINYKNEEGGYEKGYGRCCYSWLENHQYIGTCGLYKIYD